MIALSAILLTLALIDAKTFLLPDSLTLSGLWLGLLVSATIGPIEPAMAIIAAASGYSALWLLNTAYRFVRGIDGLGHGDFKLLALIGAWGGPDALIATIFIAPLVAIAVVLAQTPFAGLNGQRELPFGPYLAGAGWIALIAPPAITPYLPPWG
mgnify:CR=1 FL=1